MPLINCAVKVLSLICQKLVVVVTPGEQLSRSVNRFYQLCLPVFCNVSIAELTLTVLFLVACKQVLPDTGNSTSYLERVVPLKMFL